MENASPQTHYKKDKSKKTILIVIVVIIVLLLFGGYYYYIRKSTTHTVLSASKRKGDISIMKSSPAPLTNKQKDQLSAGTSTATKEKRFYITGGNFYFTPNTITVNQGDNVKIILNDINGMHDFVIDEMHVRTPMVRAGQFAVASFTVQNKGSYEFYCSMPGHKAQGMKGTLIIQ